MTQKEETYRFGTILLDYDGEVLISLGSAGWMSLGWPTDAGSPVAQIMQLRPIPSLINNGERYVVQEETK